MSDGPHRSLKMRRSWKRLAERAEKSSFESEEVRQELPAALEQDWHEEVPETLCRQVSTILSDSQISLFEDLKIKQLVALRGEIGGYELANVFLDFIIQTVCNERVSDKVLIEAAYNTLNDRAMRSIRQVEEHYHRKSPRTHSVDLRKRMENAVMQTDITAIARHLVGIERNKQKPKSIKRTGLDDGVKL